jgi:hypothetical protein
MAGRGVDERGCIGDKIASTGGSGPVGRTDRVASNCVAFMRHSVAWHGMAWHSITSEHFDHEGGIRDDEIVSPGTYLPSRPLAVSAVFRTCRILKTSSDLSSTIQKAQILRPQNLTPASHITQHLILDRSQQIV